MATTDLERTQQEFTLQSEAMTQGPTFQADAAIRPFVEGLGDPFPERVLDLACGPGIVSAAIARRGASVIGFDATERMLEKARTLCRAEGLDGVAFRQGDAESLPFPDESFDAAVTRLSIHHFENPLSVLKEARRVLVPGAPLVVGDIISGTDPDQARVHNAIETLRDPSHVRLLGEDELRNLIERAGFQIRSSETWENLKSFAEWAAVVADARPMGPLREVMEALAAGGNDLGIGLRMEPDGLYFTHHWRFIQAVATA